MTQPSSSSDFHRRPLLVVGLVVGMAFSLGCDPEAPPTSSDSGTLTIRDAGPPRDGSSACSSPAEGCPCEDAAPIDCFLDPTVVDDHLTCHAGTQYCRDGAWTGCESVVDFPISPAGSALLTGPTACNPCDPRCFAYEDHPGPGDLTPGNSMDVVYDPSAGGITLTPGTPVTPPLTDTDGDGIPDVADSCVGPGAFLDASGGCYGDTFFYHSLPYGGPAVYDPLNISVQVRTADIYFLMDTTGSMGGELARLRTDLTTGNFHPTLASCGNGVAGAIRCAIPDAWFGVGYFDDYPVDPYGWAPSGDVVYRNILDITASLSATQAAINTLAIHNGNDGPEGNTQALWAIASGGSLGSYLTARTSCPGTTWGYPCFRDGTIPIIIHVTDAPFHNGPGNAYPYVLSGGRTSVGGNESFGTSFNAGNVTTWTEFGGSTTGMVNDLSNPGCGSTTAPEAVYHFTVPTTQTVTLSTVGSAFDTVLTLYQRPTPTLVTGVANETFGSPRVMASPVGPDQTFTGSTSGRNNDIGAGRGAGCGQNSPDVTFRFTLPSATRVSIDTYGSSYDTVLTLWSSTTTMVACNDDSIGSASRISQTLAAGTYYVAVEGWNTSNGNFVLHFSSDLSTSNYVTCDDDSGGSLTSLITRSLTAGSYYVVVDGYGTSSGEYRLGFGTTPPATPTGYPASWSDTIAALNARDVRVITLQTCGDWGNSYCLEGESHANSLAYATNSVDGGGAPYVYRGTDTGTGLSSAIVNAVVNLANYTRMDISARVVGDVNGFTVLPITAVSWGPGSCTGISGGTTFLQCSPGTSVNFNVSFQNTSVMPTMVPQIFDFFVEVLGDGTAVLERIPVRIVVEAMLVTYPSTGHYSRDYDSTVRCAINERPVWGTLGWNVPSLPAGTSVRFDVRTADSAGALATATPVAMVTATAGTGMADITTVLSTVGAQTRLLFLQVDAVLNSSSDGFRTPTLSEVTVNYTCIPDE